MTGTRPDTRDQPTRPISVAELLAKNGTIGSPPVTGRRRRRRGNSGAVTVAELTGEIPVIRVDDEPDDDAAPDERAAAAPADLAEPVTASPAETLAGSRPEPEPGPRWPKSSAPTRSGRGLEHSPDPRPARRTSSVRAEPEPSAMFPVVKLEPEEPVVADAAAAAVDRAVPEPEYAAPESEYAVPEPHHPRWMLKSRQKPVEHESEEIPDDVADPRTLAGPGQPDDAVEAGEEYSRRSELVGGVAVVLQSILAVVFGAGLFIGFDQLWRWNSIAALVLAMLVTLGLAAAVRLVRKTDDIGSTLTAVAVGLLVTLGPLALHAS